MRAVCSDHKPLLNTTRYPPCWFLKGNSVGGTSHLSSHSYSPLSFCSNWRRKRSWSQSPFHSPVRKGCWLPSANTSVWKIHPNRGHVNASAHQHSYHRRNSDQLACKVGLNLQPPHPQKVYFCHCPLGKATFLLHFKGNTKIWFVSRIEILSKVLQSD